LRLGVLGGTLDPVHHGHLAAARAAAETLSLDRVWLMPSHEPAHKTAPLASPWHRFAMAALAVSEDARFAVSELELSRPGPTYTYDTLHRLADEGLTPSQLFFITGADAFAAIDTWYRFPDVLDAGHFVIVTRPGHRLPERIAAHPAVAPRLRDAGQQGDQEYSTCGIWPIEADTPDISSSAIRERILTGQEIGHDVPASVAMHIRRHGLYTSSAAARRLHGQS
jgi:nicotinate-nucleotide adenylyltransferase